MKRVCVVIPFYSYNIPQYQYDFIQNNINKLCRFDIFFVCPSEFNLFLLEKYPNIFIKNFDNMFFTGKHSYNVLCTSQFFYKQFIEYDYMLICQSDAYIFMDNLNEWCNKGYDYIGAPWCFQNCAKDCILKSQSKDPVGNGGLSLRKISKFIEILNGFKYNGEPEDIIFSKLIQNKPYCKEAVRFSSEWQSDIHILKHGIRPFGCHDIVDLYSCNYKELLKEIENTK